jgi:hypothetical protein
VGRKVSTPDARRRPREGHVIQVTGRLDRHETEALQVEIRTLAKRYRLSIGHISVRRVTTDSSG